MRPPVPLLVFLIAVALTAGCIGSDSGVTNDGGLFSPAAGVDVVVRNEGVIHRTVAIEITAPSGDVAGNATVTVPPGEERGGSFTVTEQGQVRVVVSAEDGGGGKAEGRGNPWECPGGARLSVTFRLPSDPTAEPEFVEAKCGHA